MDDYVLTFDVGTQSMRGVIVNSKGEIVALESTKYETPYFSDEIDHATQRVNFYYENLCDISLRLKKNYRELFDQVIGITITCFRDSTVCLDENYEPLADMILWLDKREIEESELRSIPLYKKMLFSLVGMLDVVKTQHKQSACNFLMAREKDLWAKTKKYVLLSTYLNYKLTGKLLDSSSNQIAHLPFDYKKGEWMSKNGLTRCLYDVPTDKLCDICKPGDIIGTISKKCSLESGLKEGLKLIATGSDKGCETIGLGVLDKSKAAISLGTSATIEVTSPYYFEHIPFCPSYPAAIKDHYNNELQIYAGYWMITWFIEEFCKEEIKEANELGVSVEDILDKHLKDIPIGSEGLYVEPLWMPGVDNPDGKGAIVGFNQRHNKYHIYRAIIEGINFELMRGLKLIEKRGKRKIEEIYIAGGGSKSDEICQIVADMFGLKVKRIQTNEASSLGSSIIGFVSLKVFDSYEEAIGNMVRVKEEFTPDLDNHLKYQKLYDDVYSKMYRHLLPTFKNIKKSLKK